MLMVLMEVVGVISGEGVTISLCDWHWYCLLTDTERLLGFRLRPLLAAALTPPQCGNNSQLISNNINNNNNTGVVWWAISNNLNAGLSLETFNYN